MKESNLEPYDRTTTLIFFWLQGLHFLKLGSLRKLVFDNSKEHVKQNAYPAIYYSMYEVFDNQPMQGTG